VAVVRRRDVVIEGLRYMTRWFLSPLTWRWRIFIHYIALPDHGRAMHDHPWDFWSIPLLRFYEEEVGGSYCTKHSASVPDRQCPDCALMQPAWVEHTSWLKPKFRKAEHVHRIVRVAQRGCWTLVLARQPRRQWGFWLPAGWTPATALGIKNEPEDQQAS
jgi:hypothetical protein